MIYFVLSFSLLLRLISLNQSFWLDETIQVWASQLPFDQLFGQFLPTDFNPPAYYLITHFWIRLFGNSEIGVRLTSVFLGIITIFILWKIAQKITENKKEVTITGLLLASTPLHIYYSQEARMYSLVTFGVLFTTLMVIKFLENSSWVKAAFLGFGFVLMSMSHYLSLLTLPVFVFYFGYRKKLFNPKTGFAFLILIFVWAIYFPVFRSQLSLGAGIKTDTSVWHQVIGQPSLKSAGLLPVKFVIGRINIQPQWLYGLAAGIFVFIFWGNAGLGFKRAGKYRYLFGGLLLFPPLFGFLVSFWLPVFSYFRFIFCLPFLYLLIGLSPINEKFKYGLIIFNIIFSGIYLFNPGFHRENWRGLSQWLYSQGNPQVYILNQVSIPLEYYYDGDIITLNNFDSNNLNDQVYLVSYGLPIFDPEDKIRKELIINSFELKAGDSFRQVGIEVWRK